MDAHGLGCRRVIGRLAGDARGSTAIELALTLPLLATMIFGGLWVGCLLWAVSSLDFATQSAARCMAVDAQLCGTPSATTTYAEKLYAGPDLSPAFTADASGCGHTVAVRANFNLRILPGIGDVPLTAHACYP